MLESNFQKKFIERILDRYGTEAIVLKNDSGYCQGIPDFILLYREKWALLEFKKSVNAGHRPGQDYYIGWANKHAFGAFIYPENANEMFECLTNYLEEG